jgi:hypothetical protein
MNNTVLLTVIIVVFSIVFGAKWCSDNLDKHYEKYHLSSNNNQ